MKEERNNSSPDEYLDCTGLYCPVPVYFQRPVDSNFHDLRRPPPMYGVTVQNVITITEKGHYKLLVDSVCFNWR